MSFLWKLLRIFRSCMHLRSRKSPLHSDFQPASTYSRQNAINKEWIDEYLNEAHSQGLQSVRAHFNVMAWGEDMEELKHLRNDVGSQLASMECVPRHQEREK